MDQDHEYHGQTKKTGKLHNVLPLWGNEATMNLNPLILANIQSSSYFKVHLFKLKTYHEVVDEIYYQVKHLEPWERGSRKTAGQTGMCGGVRGVGAGGIVSTAYCLLYKLYTLRLTRKQLNGLLTHTDSPYIRSLGFMYIRYTQPPADLYDWYEEYLLDEEEVDAKAGGGQPSTTIGQILHQFLVKLDWFSTLFPRIPVPIQKQIEKRLADFSAQNNVNLQARFAHAEREQNAANHAAAAAAAATAASHHGGHGGHGKAGGSGAGSYYDGNGRGGRYQQQSQHSGSGGGRSYERDRSDRTSVADRRFRSRSRDRSPADHRRSDDRYADRNDDRSDRRAYDTASSSSSSNRRDRGGDRDDYYRNGHEDRSSSDRYASSKSRDHRKYR